MINKISKRTQNYNIAHFFFYYKRKTNSGLKQCDAELCFSRDKMDEIGNDDYDILYQTSLNGLYYTAVQCS